MKSFRCAECGTLTIDPPTERGFCGDVCLGVHQARWYNHFLKCGFSEQSAMKDAVEATREVDARPLFAANVSEEVYFPDGRLRNPLRGPRRVEQRKWNGNVAIYVLADPRDGEKRYVGKTVRTVPERLKRGYDRQPVAAWLYVLATFDLDPEWEIVETVKWMEWIKAETFWIAHYRALGARLLNVTPGGLGGRRHDNAAAYAAAFAEAEALGPMEGIKS